MHFLLFLVHFHFVGVKMEENRSRTQVGLLTFLSALSQNVFPNVRQIGLLFLFDWIFILNITEMKHFTR